MILTSAILIALAALPTSQAASPRNTWPEQYKGRSAEDMAKQFEEPSRPVFRYRAAIAAMLQLKPGMTAAEIGAGSGFLARVLAQQVGPTGRVIATELEDKMVAYMNDRAKAEGLTNFTAITGQPDASGLEPDSIDAAALVTTYSFFDQPDRMLQSIVKALRPGGVVVIVDLPQAGSGRDATGVEAEEVMAASSRAGLAFVSESAVVPGHYALRFRKK